jgi:hypothetical protein
MKVLYENRAVRGGKVKLTTSEIARLGGMDRHSIQCALNHYQKNEYGYFTRYKPENKDIKTRKAYRYAITKHGIETYKQYCWNIVKGYSLHLRLFKQRKMPGYEKKDVQTSRPFREWSQDIQINDVLDYMRITRDGKEKQDIKDRCDGIWQQGTITEKIF